MVMAMADAVCDYSRTQRIVLLIDLNPLLHLPNPNPYITTVLSAAGTFLTFPPISSSSSAAAASSLFSFKLFFSSLSPILSSSKLPLPSLSLSFDHSSPTLASLSRAITSLLASIHALSPPLPSRAIHVAASIRQIVHDYAWDVFVSDPVAGTRCDFRSIVSSNLVVLFSPVVRSLEWLSEFFGVGTDDECLGSAGGFSSKFCGFFGGVKEAFVSRDIHFSWVDVKCETGRVENGVGSGESGYDFGFFERGIRELGWGFCSSDSIVLGSTLVPFGLIYPKIGISPKFFDFSGCHRIIHGGLILEILDISGKPLECKCCDLELVDLNKFPGIANSEDASYEQRKLVLEDFIGGVSKIHVNAVQKFDKCVKFEGFLYDPILVREFAGDCQKVKKESSSGSFEYRVLEILEMEMGELVLRKSMPIWQILLSFLYRKGYWALVSLSNVDGNFLTGILQPFTVSSAFLSVLGDKFQTCNMTSDFHGAGVSQFITKKENEIRQLKIETSGERKKNKRKANKCQELTWSAFCEEALEHIRIDLEEIYSGRGCNKSKKLKFLKCWMKQVEKTSYCSLTMPGRSEPDEDISKERDDRLAESPEGSAHPVASCASVGENSLTGASRIHEVDFCPETLESFFNNLPCKIQQGVGAEEVDLESLAARLVNSTIYWLYQKCEKEISPESQASVLKPGEASASIVAIELTKLLLEDPKDLTAMNRNSKPSSQASDANSARLTSENVVREYELQILFRMEILQSEVGFSIEDSTKQKFVKQICLLLEAIQCHLEGGFFGDWSLETYVEKIIKSRYCHNLEDVVHKIYAKMDLLLFDDEDEFPNPLLNSEDSNQSWREKPARDETDENLQIDQVSAEGDDARRLMEDEHQSPPATKKEEHAHKLIVAQERRQRARRFASFTSWVPDLQRVWAPKQTKAMKPKSDPLRKLSKRKEPRKAIYDMVCETPMTEKKRSNGGESISDRKVGQDYGTSLGDSVSKALFQDD